MRGNLPLSEIAYAAVSLLGVMNESVAHPGLTRALTAPQARVRAPLKWALTSLGSMDIVMEMAAEQTSVRSILVRPCWPQSPGHSASPPPHRRVLPTHARRFWSSSCFAPRRASTCSTCRRAACYCRAANSRLVRPTVARLLALLQQRLPHSHSLHGRRGARRAGHTGGLGRGCRRPRCRHRGRRLRPCRGCRRHQGGGCRRACRRGRG